VGISFRAEGVTRDILFKFFSKLRLLAIFKNLVKNSKIKKAKAWGLFVNYVKYKKRRGLII
jgi:hypothetical protein